MKNGKGSNGGMNPVWERSLLGAVLESPEVWPQAASIKPADFSLDYHRQIWSAMLALHANSETVDLAAIAARLDGRVPIDYLASLVDGVVHVNAPLYVQRVRTAARDREFHTLLERLSTAADVDRLTVVDELRQLLTAPADGEDWRGIFHTFAEFEGSRPLEFAISGFLPFDGITLIGGLASHAKTLTMLAMTRALLAAESLFGWAPFSVSQPAQRVVYLIPESSIGPFWSRLQMFRLQEFLHDDRLLVRTLSHREQQVDLTDRRILRSAEGSHVFLDTATRFMSGGEDAENTRVFANKLFQLLAAGALTATGAHHAPKSFEEAKFMTLENILRGSGDLGAMLSAGWGLRQTDKERNTVFVGNVKARDFEPIAPFVIQGRPSLDERGSFTMIEPPGQARPLRDYLDQERERETSGRPPMPNKAEKTQLAAKLRTEGQSLREIAQAIGVSKDTVSRMLFDYDLRNKEGVQ